MGDAVARWEMQLVDVWLYTSGDCHIPGFGKGESEWGESGIQPPLLSTNRHAIL